jgi:hypothetical protein
VPPVHGPFNRPSKLAVQPQVRAFIDDKHDGEPYPHIHAAIWVPSCSVWRFEQWFRAQVPFSDAVRRWHDIEGPAKVHLAPADNDPEHVGAVVRYAAKYYNHRVERGGTGEQFMRWFPDAASASKGRLSS